MTAPTCQCGTVIGDYCSSDEPADVAALFVPASDRGSILAARNGADQTSLEGIGDRLMLSRGCADILCDGSDLWIEEVAS